MARTVATTTSKLPPPIVWRDGERVVVLAAPPLAEGRVPGLGIQALDDMGLVISSRAVDLGSIVSLTGGEIARAAMLHWQARSDLGEFNSLARAPVAVAGQRITCEQLALPIRLGHCAAALAVRSGPGTNGGELLGTAMSAGSLQAVTYGAAGLAILTRDRDERDVRFADLNNDGLDDIVANVYGQGCALIGLRRADGSYDFSTPLRADGGCIGGNGETILVADFDGDGWLDVLLPAYQRFDYLHNEGNGRFREMADELGITFPDYLPRVEGAAAVAADAVGKRVKISLVNA